MIVTKKYGPKIGVRRVESAAKKMSTMPESAKIKRWAVVVDGQVYDVKKIISNIIENQGWSVEETEMKMHNMITVLEDLGYAVYHTKKDQENDHHHQDPNEIG